MDKLPTNTRPALFLVLVGVCAALHIWKLPPALPQLQEQFSLGLVEAGFLLSAVQLGGMCLGLSFGLVAERIGLRRSIMIGLGVLATSSLAGALLDNRLAVLAFRAVEGCGFLMSVMPVPGLIRRIVPAERLSRVMGLWSSYMPTATVITLLAGSWILTLGNWQLLWLLLAALTLGFLWLTPRIVPADIPTEHGPWLAGSIELVKDTLGSGKVWMVSVMFGLYTSQWMAVIGFLPTIYASQGISGTTAGLLTAVAAGVNIIGNNAAGRFLHHGHQGWILLVTGLLTMILCAWLTFAAGLPPYGAFIAVTMFSMVGGMVPATLFVLGLRFAPSAQTTSTTVGWMQQMSSLGQFTGPPVAAWVVKVSGGDWQSTWIATSAFAVIGIIIALVIRQRERAADQTKTK